MPTFINHVIHKTQMRNRAFFTTNIPCKNQCQYCFDSFLQTPFPELRYESISEYNGFVIYPCCDTEIYITNELKLFFEEYLAKSKNYNVFSFSTKKHLSVDELAYLEDLNSRLIGNNTGKIKISVSVTNKSLIDIIEPNAASYNERKELAKELSRRGITTVLIIKPILPFIPLDEYKSIISDYAEIGIKDFVTGDLYVDINSDFYRNHINKKTFALDKKHISWICNNPEWMYVDNNAQRSKIVAYIDSLSLNHYDSDIEFVNHTILPH